MMGAPGLAFETWGPPRKCRQTKFTTALCMNPRTSAAISSALVSSAKCPASSTWTSAFGTSLRYRSGSPGSNERSCLPQTHQELRLRLLHPGLPLWISIDIRAVVIEQIALNLCLPRRVQKCVLIRPKIRIIKLDLRIISHMPRLRGSQRQ